jgi:hypothetical protein
MTLKDIRSVLLEVREDELGDIQEREGQFTVARWRLGTRGRIDAGQICGDGQRIDGEIERVPLIDARAEKKGRENAFVDDGRRSDVEGLLYGGWRRQRIDH